MPYKINVEIDVPDTVDFAQAYMELEESINSMFGEDVLALEITDADGDDTVGVFDMTPEPEREAKPKRKKKPKLSSSAPEPDGVDSGAAPAQERSDSEESES